MPSPFPGMDPYLEDQGYWKELHTKHFELIHQAVHLVELDFLIGGKRLPIDADLPPGQYFAFVSRAEWRPMSDVYAWSIRDPLPTIPIPLLAPDPDVSLDLAPIFQSVYERARYERSVDYKAPLRPPLSPENRAWAQAIAHGFDSHRAH